MSEKGISPLAEKLDAITEMEPPKDLTEARAYLGMVNQLKRWFPDLTCNMANIRRLLYKGVEYEWTKEMQKEFDTVKEIITSPTYF